jgi:hypothetical protein
MIQSNRHSTGSRLNGAVLQNGKVTKWAISPNAEFTTRSSYSRQLIRFRLHRSEYGLSGSGQRRIFNVVLK